MSEDANKRNDHLEEEKSCGESCGNGEQEHLKEAQGTCLLYTSDAADE